MWHGLSQVQLHETKEKSERRDRPLLFEFSDESTAKMFIKNCEFVSKYTPFTEIKILADRPLPQKRFL